MFKILVFLSLFISSAFDIPTAPETALSICPSVTDLQKTGQTPSSIAYSWSNVGSQYRVWYTRSEDSYTSSYFYTTTASYNFTGLSAGHYTFYFQTVCGETSSGYIVIEDVISA